jgi:hypothetical protein
MAKDLESPLVSIVIPVFNGALFIAEAIESALTQSYKNTEILVINDGSNDHGETSRIIKSYEKHLEVIHKPNGGCASALNRGLVEMRGAYFSWLSHDDIYQSEKIESQVELVLANTKNSIIYSNFYVIDHRGALLQQSKFETVFRGDALASQFLPIANSLVNGCSMLIPRNLLSGGFNTKYETTQDYEKWLQIFPSTNIVFCEHPGVYSRRHLDQDSNTNPRHEYESDSFWLHLIESVLKGVFRDSTLDSLEMLILISDHLKDTRYARAQEMLIPLLREIHLDAESNSESFQSWKQGITTNTLSKVRV